MPTPHNPPAAVRRALRKLGADIHDARRRRRLPMAVVAERAFTSRSTLQKVEAGDTNVSIGIYAGVLQALGLLDGAARLLAPGAPLILYGPWIVPGEALAPSNAEFDRSLKARDPRWGLRVLERFTAEAEARGLELADRRAMPANNLSLRFARVG